MGKIDPQRHISLHIKSSPSNHDKIFELSRNRHFLARYMDFWPSPLNSSLTQWRVRDGEGGVIRSECVVVVCVGGVLFDVFLLYPK